jgi:hypothetical protein
MDELVFGGVSLDVSNGSATYFSGNLVHSFLFDLSCYMNLYPPLVLHLGIGPNYPIKEWMPFAVLTTWSLLSVATVLKAFQLFFCPQVQTSFWCMV